jgi:putative oxidoreductase
MTKLLSSSPANQDYGIAIVRIITGMLLVYHGWEVFSSEKMTMYTGWFTDKHYPQPAFWAYAGKLAELLAGIGFVLGLFTRLSSIAAILAFTGIIFMVGYKGKIFEGDQHPFLFILLSLVFIFTGPGALSLDALFFKKRN